MQKRVLGFVLVLVFMVGFVSASGFNFQMQDWVKKAFPGITGKVTAEKKGSGRIIDCSSNSNFAKTHPKECPTPKTCVGLGGKTTPSVPGSLSCCAGLVWTPSKECKKGQTECSGTCQKIKNPPKKGTGYSSAEWTCYDGTQGGSVRGIEGNLPCLTSDTFNSAAQKFCDGRCSDGFFGLGAKCGVNSFSVDVSCSL